MEAKDKLVETLCIGCCDGYDGRCQRYPKLSRTCKDFYPMEKAYKAGMEEESTQAYHAGIHDGVLRGRREVVEFLSETSMDAHTLIFQVSQEGWQAKLKEWGL